MKTVPDNHKGKDTKYVKKANGSLYSIDDTVTDSIKRLKPIIIIGRNDYEDEKEQKHE